MSDEPVDRDFLKSLHESLKTNVGSARDDAPAHIERVCDAWIAHLTKSRESGVVDAPRLMILTMTIQLVCLVCSSLLAIAGEIRQLRIDHAKERRS